MSIMFSIENNTHTMHRHLNATQTGTNRKKGMKWCHWTTWQHEKWISNFSIHSISKCMHGRAWISRSQSCAFIYSSRAWKPFKSPLWSFKSKLSLSAGKITVRIKNSVVERKISPFAPRFNLWCKYTHTCQLYDSVCLIKVYECAFFSFYFFFVLKEWKTNYRKWIKAP